MTRFFGDAVFEGSEVSDSDYNRLADQRTWEAGRISDTHTEEASAITSAERWADDTVARLEAEIRNTRDEEARAIASAERWARDTIARIKDTAAGEIGRILSGVRIETVYEVVGEPTACAICSAKIGTIGTMEMLEELDCIPPFHENCRCSLEEVGYYVL